MIPDPMAPFFTVHRNLPREGPGTEADVLWALDQVGLPPNARVVDAACGPGADLETLAKALPDAQIEGIDQVSHFVTAAQARVAAHHPRVSARHGDMATLQGPYDLIWCAGALYLLGVTEGLRLWRPALSSGGAVAFSEPVMLSRTLSETAQKFWAEYPSITDMDGIAARVAQAGYRTCAKRVICGAAWAAYYDPMQVRIDALRGQAQTADLTEALDEAQQEIDLWRTAPDEIAYALLIVAPA